MVYHFVIMNTNFSLTRKVRTLSLSLSRRRRPKPRGHLLSSSSSSLEGMAQLHPPHVEAGEVTEVLTRMLEPKRFIYKINIKWSDGTSSTSYRSYSEFFDFQCSLLVEFPVEGGNKGGTRTIPYLPGKKIFKKTTYDLALERQPQIHDYVTELLSLPEHISRSERLLRFFKSNWQEDRLRRGENEDGANYSVRYVSKGAMASSEHGACVRSYDSAAGDGLSRTDSEEPIVLGI